MEREVCRKSTMWHGLKRGSRERERTDGAGRESGGEGETGPIGCLVRGKKKKDR